MADVQRLAHRALSPWLQHVARRPMPRGVPKGAPELSEVPRGPWMAQPKTAEALGKLHGLNGEATFEERLSAHFVLLRHGRSIRSSEAEELWEAVPKLSGLSGHKLCDLLYVLGAARSFRYHRRVAEEVAKSMVISQKEYSRELQLWPQTLPLVCEYLVWHLDDPHLMKSFLTSVLVPFWRLHPAAVQGALVPHHAMAVSSACARAGKKLPLEVLQTVREALCRWCHENLRLLGPRGLANMALALSRVPGLAGEDANAQQLKHLLARTRELLLEVDDFPASSAAKSAPLFRADWLGMFVSALARARCREDLPTLKQLLEIHFQKKILAGEAQNLALCAHSVLKLDLLDLRRNQPLVALAPHVKELGRLQGTSGARSACLLAHAYGSALLLHRGPIGEVHAVYDEVLQYLLDSKHKLKLQNIKLRFQMLTAVQCWWQFIDTTSTSSRGSSLASLRRVHQTLAAVSAALPGPEESIGEQEVISTTDHAEVARALPAEVQPRARMEDFAFPFWLDIVLIPLRRVEEKEWPSGQRGPF